MKDSIMNKLGGKIITYISLLGAVASIVMLVCPKIYRVYFFITFVIFSIILILFLNVRKNYRIIKIKENPIPTNSTNYRIEKRKIYEKLNSKNIYSAPGAVFIMGEHSVVYGQPCIYLPIPQRVYVSARKQSGVNLSLTLYVRSPENPELVENIRDINCYDSRYINEHLSNLQKWYEQQLVRFLKPINGSASYGLEVISISDFPVACGLNSSGAFSSALACLIYDQFLDVEKFNQVLKLPRSGADAKHLIAWSLENCFHSNRSSGAGSFASIVGRSTHYPLIFLGQKRSFFKSQQEIGYIPIEFTDSEFGLSSVFDSRSSGFDTSRYITSNDKENSYSWALIYSGKTSLTSDTLRIKDIRPFYKGTTDIVSEISEQIRSAIGDENLADPIKYHIKDVIDNIYLNNKIPDHKKTNLMNYALEELLYQAMGIICVLGMNSFLSNWAKLNLYIRTYQEMLNMLDLCSKKVMMITDAFNSYKLGDERIFAAKMTGSGPEGDVLVFSKEDEKSFKNHFNKVTEILNEQGNPVTTVHFVSSDYKGDLLKVEGVRRE